MKKNLPVTGQERTVPEDVRLVSRTDTKGIITFANDAFVEVSGYTRDELLGSPHNIVRNPDVPPAVFEDMWKTLETGLPWRGLVKNRCKNGDYYWVDAHVVPVRKNGETIGYMSVRTKPTREAIAKAQAEYEKIARTGEVESQAATVGWKRLLSVKNGVTLGIVFVTLMMIAGGILGITGLTLSVADMRGLYFQQMAPVQDIGRINFLMADNRAQVALALRDQSAGREASVVAERMARLEKNKQEIEQLWAGYSKLPRSAAERELANQYWIARERYVEAGLLPAKLALEQGDHRVAERVMRNNVDPMYDEANERANALLGFLSDKARGDFLRVADRNEAISVVAVVGISVGCLVLVLAGVYFFRATVVPLQSAVVALEHIAEGNLSGETGTVGYGEPGRVMTGVTVMQLHLKVMMDEIRQSAGSIREQCQRLNNTMMNLAQHSEEQHDRVYHTVDTASVTGEGLNKLAADADAMLSLAERLTGTAQAALAAPDAAPEFETRDDAESAELAQMAQMAHDLAVAVRIEAFAMADTVAHMNQVADLIVENRGEVQGAWAASQQLEKTARELDRLVKYFD